MASRAGIRLTPYSLAISHCFETGRRRQLTAQDFLSQVSCDLLRRLLVYIVRVTRHQLLELFNVAGILSQSRRQAAF
ncbi:MAG: hypothetical protein VYA71_03065, partial [Pseudomonadota bacterium]|nr:hypothetical protein [Pseudomonadota bacterium]